MSDDPVQYSKKFILDPLGIRPLRLIFVLQVVIIDQDTGVKKVGSKFSS
jgi:hypothetical protein